MADAGEPATGERSGHDGGGEGAGAGPGAAPGTRPGDADDTAAGALLHAWLLDGRGGARRIGAADIACWHESDGMLWVHANFQHPGILELLARVPGLDGRHARLLASDDTRPSTDCDDDTARITLRGVNLHPESDPEDMVSVRLWATSGRVVSTRRRHVLSIDDIVAALAVGEGPQTPGELLATVAARLVERAQGIIDVLDERVTAIEEAMARAPATVPQHDIADVRRIAITLRRHLAPQRDALSQLAHAPLGWLAEVERTAIRDALDGLQRHVEDLDLTRERATVAREELTTHAASLTNARMYLLSLLSAIFLPLGFVTGLLGINVGGMPGANDAHGFLVASIGLAFVAVLILLFLRFRRWL